MDKQTADAIITAYSKKLFGFALSKTRNVQEAEELAARTVCEVYQALLAASHVENTDAYIRRIARNVHARFIGEALRAQSVPFLDEQLSPESSALDPAQALIEGQTLSLLRREITFLSKMQREILLLYYYDRKKQEEIAKILQIPVGTVKWHLFEAKNCLKEGLEMKREQGTLGLRPIRLNGLGVSGTPGGKGETWDFLSRRLTQNIVYAAYHETKTIHEIAEELGVSPLFVEDEVAVLEEYGFMEKKGGKYQAQILIHEPNAQVDEKRHDIYQKYAKILCDKYVPSVIDALRQTPQDKIYVPDGDENLLLWAGILYACTHKLGQLPPKTESESKYYTKRPDGGNYLALAALDVPDYKVSFDQRLYSYCGAMQTVSEKYPVASWQINTVFDGRTADLSDEIDRDYAFLYEFIAGQLPKNKANLEKYQRLYELGYLRADDTPNLIFLKVTEGDVPHGGAGWWPIPLPPPAPKLAEVSLAMAAEIGETAFLAYPPHMRATAKARGARPIADIRFSLYILHELLARGVLRLPSDTQKAGLTTLVFSDRLPG